MAQFYFYKFYLIKTIQWLECSCHRKLLSHCHLFIFGPILYHKEKHMWAANSQSRLCQTAWEILKFHFPLNKYLIFFVLRVPGHMN